MHADAYRQLERLAANGVSPSRLEAEIGRYPRAEQGPLCRYAWGLLDDRYDADEVDAMWLHAWVIESRYGDHARSPHI